MVGLPVWLSRMVFLKLLTLRMKGEEAEEADKLSCFPRRTHNVIQCDWRYEEAVVDSRIIATLPRAAYKVASHIASHVTPSILSLEHYIDMGSYYDIDAILTDAQVCQPKTFIPKGLRKMTESAMYIRFDRPWVGIHGGQYRKRCEPSA